MGTLALGCIACIFRRKLFTQLHVLAEPGFQDRLGQTQMLRFLLMPRGCTSSQQRRLWEGGRFESVVLWEKSKSAKGKEQEAEKIKAGILVRRDGGGGG